MTSPVAYKVLTDAEMKELETGAFMGSAVDHADGFIHLSTADQLTETVDKHFAGQSDLWVAAVDLAAEGQLVKWETSRGGALFPHLYGTLLLETVIAYSPLERDGDGAVRLPVAG
jgi:uncharacterized protein (DUF952 family)